MQHEGVGIPPQLCHDERHTLRHKAGHERDIAGKPIQLGHEDEAFGSARGAKCGRQLRPTVKGVGALPRFGLRVFADQYQPLSCREALDRRPLGFYAKARALLSLRRDPKICDSAIH